MPQTNSSFAYHFVYVITVGGHGYSSPLVCLFVRLFVISESTHLDIIALRLFTAWIASTQQVISFIPLFQLKSG